MSRYMRTGVCRIVVGWLRLAVVILEPVDLASKLADLGHQVLIFSHSEKVCQLLITAI
jgi:hypothetical protein